MEIIKFKTNLKCNGCISAVSPSLNAIEGLTKWEVDLSSPDRIMNTEIEKAGTADSIIAAFKNAGYEATQI
ncbi:MAG: hypothetical protein IPN08_09255 [Bacteroidales bacterium]|nr:hypothetical protein [Bacteroidales bacterium]MBK9357555.1 hypothetical protein [Bacteroidales bacterium]